MRLALPIFAATAGGEEGAVETFGQPDPLNPLCGAPCYNSASGDKLWGLVSAAVPEMSRRAGAPLLVSVSRRAGAPLLV
jgi:hypothetical protein